MISRSSVTKAVQELRSHFGETQQQFAQRIKTAVVTIARWETSRPPSGEALERLLALAQSENLAECTHVFEQALKGDVEPPHATSKQTEVSIFHNNSEKLLTIALISALRDREEYGVIAESVESALQEILREYRMSFDRDDVQERVARAVVDFHGRGDTAEKIAEILDINPTTIERILLFDQFGFLPRMTASPDAGDWSSAPETNRRRSKRPGADIKRIVASPKMNRKRDRRLSTIIDRYLNSGRLQEEKEI